MLAIFVHPSSTKRAAALGTHHAQLPPAHFRPTRGRPAGCHPRLFSISTAAQQPMSRDPLFSRPRAAMTDGLTGLFNRRYFDINLGKEVRRALRYRKDLWSPSSIWTTSSSSTIRATSSVIWSSSASVKDLSTSREEDIVHVTGRGVVLLSRNASEHPLWTGPESTAPRPVNTGSPSGRSRLLPLALRGG